MQALFSLLSVAANLLVLGAHVCVPWRLAGEGPAARRSWALASLPLLLLATLLTLLRFAAQTDRLLAAGFESPLWRAPPAQALGLLVVTLCLSDAVLLGAASHLESAGWRLASGVGLLALVGFTYIAEATSPLGGGPPLLLLRACLRSSAAVAVGLALAPVPPGRSPAPFAGATGVLFYLLLVPRETLVTAWARGDLLLALLGTALLLGPRLLLLPRRRRGREVAGRGRRVLLALAALSFAGFWTRLDAVPPTPLVSSATREGHVMSSLQGPGLEQTGVKLPLFPLPNVVHFPRTELRLHIFEPRYRRLVLDLLGRAAGERWIGMVLLRPGSAAQATEPPIFRAGTAGRMVEVEPLPDGRSNIVLEGGFRFEVESELSGRPYREANVRRITEPALEERDPGVVAVRRELLAKARSLATELGERFPLPLETVRSLEERRELETVVNAFAAHLDLPVLRKLELLGEPLPERALSVLGILRSRQKVVDLLRPYRHLAGGAEFN